MIRSNVLKLVSNLLLSSTLLLTFSVSASEGMHMDDHDKDHGMSDRGEHMETESGHSSGMESHGHDFWVTPPPEYRDKRNANWNDRNAVLQGMGIFAQQCAQCHGVSGTGDGPVAVNLSHKPADLSKHFHARDGVSDAYLFWRVSEGGTVEPFKSANSAMPAFKGSLTEKQRWDVLTYIHLQIHKGFHLSRMIDNEDVHATNESG
ncbi:c-type cytochrome [Sedimenticola hydrogenitrophicus]|uniref:c-type cytochrome n=1 Tax=Sedimenticola hydrogenitrophicus TaxID=2967975 RepID=UPI0021A90936|nr:cytochrome c [Sedimenticola hydrogenitrophicus]